MALLEGSALLWFGLLGALLYYQFVLQSPTIQRNGAPLRKPPNTLPIVGNGILFLRPRQKLFSWFVKCERQFGHETFQINVPTLPPGVVINDPKNLDYVFKNEGIFSKGDLFKRLSWDLFGYGIINVDGELWKTQRKAGLAFLNASNLRVLTEVALPRYLGLAVDYLRAQASAESDVDLQHVFHEITSQLMGKMAYDMEMHADDEFTVAFDYASGVTTERFQNPLWFITEFFTGFRFRGALHTIRTFGLGIVESAAETRKNPRDARSALGSASDRLDEVSGSLIQSLLDVFGDDQKLVSDAALNYLSAGRDTVAQALTWCMYLLMQHRFVAGKIRNEVRTSLGNIQEPFVISNGSDIEKVNSNVFTPTSLPYTMATFYETLRLYPPIPFEIKQCEKPTTLPDGTFLPEKAIVFWCTWAMNRSKVTWGEDAESFRPERWLTEDGKLVTKSAAEFPVFNGGPRLCLGKRMAESLAIQVIATMVLLFDFMPHYEGERVSKSSLTLPMKGGLPCLVKPRRFNPG
ncbi:cytochrome P450 [Annulohypoxylon maeteangense]|uniref:cytochrome P450 n=1 Tax=Annulohypoxylon maeteangense TaxID=1927788 RepID=UPI002007A072|nr:cytochrome P450 [Annulohypoxylon maeteangense]KAI0888281.1 cytochrome P450 [Annulohypoxylon maeteangense]